MNLIMLGSPLCPDCVEAERLLKEKGIPYEDRNISASLAHLKEFLKLRESEACFAPVIEAGSIGIPCFILPDGKVTVDTQEALAAVSK